MLRCRLHLWLLLVLFLLLGAPQPVDAQDAAATALARISKLLAQQSPRGHHQYISIADGQLLYRDIQLGHKEEVRVYATDLDVTSVGVSNKGDPSTLHVSCRNLEDRVHVTDIQSDYAAAVRNYDKMKRNFSSIIVLFNSDSRIESELLSAFNTVLRIVQQSNHATIPIPVDCDFDGYVSQLERLEESLRSVNGEIAGECKKRDADLDKAIYSSDSHVKERASREADRLVKLIAVDEKRQHQILTEIDNLIDDRW